MSGLPGEDMIRLPVVSPRGKGLKPWRPRAGSKNARMLSAAQAALARLRKHWPLGSREVGYVLTGDEFGFTHDNIDAVEDVVAFARRAGYIPWEAISDGRTSVAAPWVVDDAEDLADQVLAAFDDAQFDRQAGQRYRVEVWTEGARWLDRLARICNERGVEVYSGSGSVPVDAVRKAAKRAIATYAAAVRDGRDVTTVIFWIGDLDLNGIRNISQPFDADVRQFVIDLLRQQLDLNITAEEADAILVVRRLLITPDQAAEHVGVRGRARPTRKAKRAGWPYEFTVQAEALPPDVRDRIVAKAIDGVHNVALRKRVVARERALHHDARVVADERLRDLLSR